MVSYLQTFWLVFSLALSSPRLHAASPLSELGAPCRPDATHFEMATRREPAPAAAQHTGSTDRTATAVRHLPLSQTGGPSREELRSRPARPLARASLRVLPHFGFRSAALGKRCTRLLGTPDIQGRPGSQRSGDAPRSCRSEPLVRFPNMAAARPRRLNRAQEPHVNVKKRFPSSESAKLHSTLCAAFVTFRYS